MISNLNKRKIPTIRQADINYGMDYESMSPLGQQLCDIAREIELSDEPSFDEDAIEKELLDHRGGYGNE